MSRAELELEGASLEPGQSIRLVCPFCGGGAHKERSLSLTLRTDGALLYNCYRNACTARGALGGNRLPKEAPVAAYRTKPDPTDRLAELENFSMYWDMIGHELRRLGWKWDPETERLALPVFGPRHVRRGYVLRAPPGSTKVPKVLTVPTAPEPQLAWNLVNDPGRVIVVEDIPSATKLNFGSYRAVALNGTHMTDEAREELMANTEAVVFALDADAFAKGVKYASQFGLYMKSATALKLEKDFKDMDAGEIDKCLLGISWLRAYETGGRGNR